MFPALTLSVVTLGLKRIHTNLGVSENRGTAEVLQVLERPLGTAWCSAALPTDVVLPAGAQAQQEATVPK